MKPHGRALNVWIDITWAGIPSLVLLSVVLGWSAVVQVVLMTLSVGAVFGTRIAVTHAGRKRAACARGQRGRSAPSPQGRA